MQGKDCDAAYCSCFWQGLLMFDSGVIYRHALPKLKAPRSNASLGLDKCFLS